MSDAASELARLRAALAAAGARADVAESELAQARAVVSCSEATIQELKLEIAKLRRDKYGISSARRARLIDQLELQLEEMEAAATDDALAADQASEKASTVRAFTRRHPVRNPFPDHLSRERVVVEAPVACTCCGSDRIVKMGEDITETLEVIPRQWKVIQTVREKFTRRACEKISQPPAPFHAIPRGWAGPSLIAKLILEKYGQHQPLNRQAERFAREGVELSLYTLADRLWTYVRDDRPWNGGAPPAAFFRFSRDRAATNPNQHLAGWQGVLQADAYGGYNDLYRKDRDTGPVTSALCWSHARRKFFELADIAGNVREGKPAHQISPVALEAVKRIDAIFDIEREINGLDADARLAARQNLSLPLVNGLHDWLQEERAKLSRHNKVAKAINYMFEKRGRWQAFTAFLEDGRICLTNNAAERALRGVALGRKSWLADLLARLPDLPVSRVHELLLWNWKALSLPQAA
ncbi:IS66 family transposase [Sulfitobacter sp. 1A13353]|uniref:IS66 family transposase n=1 Tax=Sulfitobacter sp. 1A13353 TaxID=3368568 RepID=UPI003744F2E3